MFGLEGRLGLSWLSPRLQPKHALLKCLSTKSTLCLAYLVPCQSQHVLPRVLAGTTLSACQIEVCVVQINTALQSALWSLAAYPTLLNFPLLEALAEKYAQPSSSKIMSQPPDHALTWQNVEAYIGALGTMHTYVPFLSSSQAKASVL